MRAFILEVVIQPTTVGWIVWPNNAMRMRMKKLYSFPLLTYIIPKTKGMMKPNPCNIEEPNYLGPAIFLR